MYSFSVKLLALILLVVSIAGPFLADEFKGTEDYVIYNAFPKYGSIQQNSLNGWVQFSPMEMTHLVTEVQKEPDGRNGTDGITYHSLYLAKGILGQKLVYDDVTVGSASSSDYSGSLFSNSNMPSTLYGQLSTVASKFSQYSDYHDTLEQYGDYDLLVDNHRVTRVKRYVQTFEEEAIQFLLSKAYFLFIPAILLGIIGFILGKKGK